jgi:ATP-dependent RNA helicase DeaD
LELSPGMRGVMFCRTKRETQEIANELSDLGFGVEALHGDLSQNQRDAVMSRFKSRSMQLLIATDVAARGIDVAELSHVFHHKLPDQPENYTHRSGRTGRAGKKGVSIAFINPREQRKIRELEKMNNITFSLLEVPTKSELKGAKINNWANLILETKVDKSAEAIMEQVADKFEHLSKEDILKRLISTQLDHLMGQGREADDINESSGKKANVSAQNETERYFVNVGTMDGVTAGDLVHFLSDITAIDRKQFSNFSIQKNCSFFDLKSTEPLDFDKLFEFVEVNGRSIRVNRDVDTPRGRGGNKGRSNSRSGKSRSQYSSDPVSRKGRERSNSRRKGRRG